jgi:hypothetical protein
MKLDYRQMVLEGSSSIDEIGGRFAQNEDELLRLDKAVEDCKRKLAVLEDGREPFGETHVAEAEEAPVVWSPLDEKRFCLRGF